jgi:uncharacterized protein (DUF1499 family)
MKRLAMTLWIVFAVAFVIVGYIRLAPSDPAKWHVDLDVTQDEDMMNGATRVLPKAGQNTMDALHDIALATPRTALLAGGPTQDHATYVTRSLVMGFPDYTTVQLKDGTLMILARQRFGRSDLGVNKRRVDDWLGRLEP